MSARALVPTNGPAAMQLAFELGAVTTATSLDITNPDIDFDGWENIGRQIGFVGSAWQWWVGDWLLFGEELFGEEAAQAIESTPRERFSIAERITGVDHGHMQNIVSVCRKVAKQRRRPELKFSHHTAVSALDPEEQIVWLDRAIEEGWTRDQLRDAIREDKRGPVDPEPDPDPDPGEPTLTLAERIEQAARVVWNQGQPTSDGDTLVPAEAWTQLGAALGEE